MNGAQGEVVDLWGNVVDPYVKLVERYGVWPTTVWNCAMSDPGTRSLKELTGDAGEARPEVFTKTADDKSVYRGKVTTSIFNPAVAAWALNMFGPDQPAVIFDPFAGGGTRALVSAAKGYEYRGVELRAEETAAVSRRLAARGLSDGVDIRTADARSVPFPSDSADFLLTCPPYWNLEQYNGGAADLSMAPTYDAFLRQLGEVVRECGRVLRRGSLAVWVTGLIRDSAGRLLPIPHDLARLHAQHGFVFREEVILNQQGNGAIQRVGNFEKGGRRLVRVHEYLSVFRKGTT